MPILPRAQHVRLERGKMNKEICKRCLLKQLRNNHSASKKVKVSGCAYGNRLVVRLFSKSELLMECFKDVEFKKKSRSFVRDEKSIKWDEMFLREDSECPYYVEHYMHDLSAWQNEH